MKNLEFTEPTQPFHIKMLRMCTNNTTWGIEEYTAIINYPSEDDIWVLTDGAKQALQNFIAINPSLADNLGVMINAIRNWSSDMYHALDELINPEANLLHISSLGSVSGNVHTVLSIHDTNERLSKRDALQANRIQIFIKNPEMGD